MAKVYQSIKDFIRDQQGISVILVAFSMFMIIGFTAIVVDAGSLFFEKSRLQKSLDAAVLGGAQVLRVSQGEAVNIAIGLANKNGFTVSGGEVSTGENFIEISKTVTKDLTFARVLGMNQADVPATARAELVKPLIEGEGIIPVGLEITGFTKGAAYALNEKPGEGNSGNYNYLAIDGNGANVLGEGIKHGSKTKVKVNQSISTETGQNWGKVEEGFKYRINQDQAKTHCSSYDTADKNCNRVVIVPLIDSFIVNGKKPVKVVGFAAFWIESVSKHEIKGRFIEVFTSGTFGEEENDFGIYGVKLVK